MSLSNSATSSAESSSTSTFQFSTSPSYSSSSALLASENSPLHSPVSTVDSIPTSPSLPDTSTATPTATQAKGLTTTHTDEEASTTSQDIRSTPTPFTVNSSTTTDVITERSPSPKEVDTRFEEKVVSPSLVTFSPPSSTLSVAGGWVTRPDPISRTPSLPKGTLPTLASDLNTFPSSKDEYGPSSQSQSQSHNQTQTEQQQQHQQQRRVLYSPGAGGNGTGTTDIWSFAPVPPPNTTTTTTDNYNNNNNNNNNDPLRTGRAASDGILIGNTKSGLVVGGGKDDPSDWERGTMFRDRERRSLESSSSNIRLMGQPFGLGSGGSGGSAGVALASPPTSGGTTVTSGSSTSYFGGSSSLSPSTAMLSLDSANTTPATSSNRSSGSAPSGDSAAASAVPVAAKTSVVAAVLGDESVSLDGDKHQSLHLHHHHQQQQQHQQQQHHQQHHQGSASLHLGDLDVWMDEAYVRECCARMGWEGATNIKIIRGASPSSGYCFLTFPSAEQAANVLAKFNVSPPMLMPRSTRTFKLNWGTGLPGVQPRWEGEYSVFVGDLGREVGEPELVSLFNPLFPSTKSAKIMYDPSTGLSRGYGFVRFADEADLHRALLLGQHSGSGLSLHGRTLRISEASGPSGGGSLHHHHHQHQQHQHPHQHQQQYQNNQQHHQQQQQYHHHHHQNQHQLQNQHQNHGLQQPPQQHQHNPLHMNSQYNSYPSTTHSMYGDNSMNNINSNNSNTYNLTNHTRSRSGEEQAQDTSPAAFNSGDSQLQQQQQDQHHSQQNPSSLLGSFGPLSSLKGTPLSPSSPSGRSGFHDLMPIGGRGGSTPPIGTTSTYGSQQHRFHPNQAPPTPLSPSSSQFHPMSPMLGSVTGGMGREGGGGPMSPFLGGSFNHSQIGGGGSHRHQHHPRRGGGGGGGGGGGAGSHTTDPNNTTVFVGGLPACISEETLKSFFHHFGEITYCKIPTGKGCGFVQFVRRTDAELAILKMNDFPIHGKSRIRLSWGRSQGDKQVEHVRKLASALGVPFEAVWRMVQGQDNTTIKQITSAVGGGSGAGAGGSINSPHMGGGGTDGALSRGANMNPSSRFESLGVGRMDLGAVASAAGLTEAEVMELVGGRSSSSSGGSQTGGGYRYGYGDGGARESDLFARSSGSIPSSSTTTATSGGPYSRVPPSTFSAFSSGMSSLPTGSNAPILSPVSGSLPPLSPPPSAGPFSNQFQPYSTHSRFSHGLLQQQEYPDEQQQYHYRQQPLSPFRGSVSSGKPSPYSSVRSESYSVHSPTSPFERGEFADGDFASMRNMGIGGGSGAAVGLDESLSHLNLGFNGSSSLLPPSFSVSSQEFLPSTSSPSYQPSSFSSLAKAATGESGMGFGGGAEWGSWQGRPTSTNQRDVQV